LPLPQCRFWLSARPVFWERERRMRSRWRVQPVGAQRIPTLSPVRRSRNPPQKGKPTEENTVKQAVAKRPPRTQPRPIETESPSGRAVRNTARPEHSLTKPRGRLATEYRSGIFSGDTIRPKRGQLPTQTASDLATGAAPRATQLFACYSSRSGPVSGQSAERRLAAGPEARRKRAGASH